METDIFKLKIGDKAADFELPSVDGNAYKLSDFKSKVLVIFFTCNHCPYAQAYEDRVMAMAEQYFGKVDFVGINSNDAAGYPDDSYEKMVERASERKFNFKYLYDESQEVAKAYGGMCTPHFYVFDQDRLLRYQGGFDDSWEDEGAVTRTPLKDAIETALLGKAAPVPHTIAIGCSIKWKPKG